MNFHLPPIHKKSEGRTSERNQACAQRLNNLPTLETDGINFHLPEIQKKDEARTHDRKQTYADTESNNFHLPAITRKGEGMTSERKQTSAMLEYLPPSELDRMNFHLPKISRRNELEVGEKGQASVRKRDQPFLLDTEKLNSHLPTRREETSEGRTSKRNQEYAEKFSRLPPLGYSLASPKRSLRIVCDNERRRPIAKVVEEEKEPRFNYQLPGVSSSFGFVGGTYKRIKIQKKPSRIPVYRWNNQETRPTDLGSSNIKRDATDCVSEKSAPCVKSQSQFPGALMRFGFTGRPHIPQRAASKPSRIPVSNHSKVYNELAGARSRFGFNAGSTWVHRSSVYESRIPIKVKKITQETIEIPERNSRLISQTFSYGRLLETLPIITSKAKARAYINHLGPMTLDYQQPISPTDHWLIDLHYRLHYN